MAKKKMLEHTSTIEGAVDDAMSEAEGLRDELTEWRDNLDGSNMSHLPKYEEVSEAVDALDCVDNKPEIPNTLPTGLVDEVKWQTHAKRRQSRADRMGEVTFALQIVAEHIEAFLEKNEDENAACWKDTSRSDWEQYASDLNDIRDELDGVSFPGMY